MEQSESRGSKREESTPVKLPNDMIEELDRIKEQSNLHFKSRPDVLKYLIRKYIEENNQV